MAGCKIGIPLQALKDFVISLHTLRAGLAPVGLDAAPLQGEAERVGIEGRHPGDVGFVIVPEV